MANVGAPLRRPRYWFASWVLAALVLRDNGCVRHRLIRRLSTRSSADFATDHSPGCAVGAARGDAPLAAKAYGIADLEHNIPLTPQSVFYMASVSKQFMALSILLLERDGKLQLEDRVRTYLPELPEHAAGITIRQLLHHTSGLRDYLTLSGLAGNPPDYVITERGVLNTLARQMRLNFEPWRRTSVQQFRIRPAVDHRPPCVGTPAR